MPRNDNQPTQVHYEANYVRMYVCRWSRNDVIFMHGMCSSHVQYVGMLPDTDDLYFSDKFNFLAYVRSQASISA